jgi:hypothetical protein
LVSLERERDRRGGSRTYLRCVAAFWTGTSPHAAAVLLDGVLRVAVEAEPPEPVASPPVDPPCRYVPLQPWRPATLCLSLLEPWRIPGDAVTEKKGIDWRRRGLELGWRIPGDAIDDRWWQQPGRRAEQRRRFARGETQGDWGGQRATGWAAARVFTVRLPFIPTAVKKMNGLDSL